jgi:hypothetical protein
VRASVWRLSSRCSGAMDAVRQLDSVKAVELGKADPKTLETESDMRLSLTEGIRLYKAYAARSPVTGGTRPKTRARYKAVFDKFVGSGVGRVGLPRDWLLRLWEWPLSVAWMERLADATSRAVSSAAPVSSPRLVPGVGILRNVVFLAVVLAHAFRRFLPPY